LRGLAREDDEHFVGTVRGCQDDFPAMGGSGGGGVGRRGSSATTPGLENHPDTFYAPGAEVPPGGGSAGPEPLAASPGGGSVSQSTSAAHLPGRQTTLKSAQ
jgi:hypothetical protein